MSDVLSDPSSTHTSCVRTAKALARLRGCAGSPPPSLIAYVISTIISWAGSYIIIWQFHRFSLKCLPHEQRIYVHLPGNINGMQFKVITALARSNNWLCVSIIWAQSSEFLSSSIPSWQILTAHAQPFRGARDLAFCLKVPLDPPLVWASSKGSGETARMRRLAWTFAARIGDKYQIRLTRSIWCFYFLLHSFLSRINVANSHYIWSAKIGEAYLKLFPSSK